MEKPAKPVDSRVLPFLAGPWPVVVLLGCHFALGLSAAGRKSVTFDEITHLSSGYSYWATGDYRMDPESGNWPQRWIALPVWLEGYHFPSLDEPTWKIADQWNFAYQFFYGSGNDADAMLLQGRAMVGLLSVALGLLVYLWSRQLFGPVGGLISLTLYAFSPTMLSHGFLVTADLTAALFFTASMWALWRLLHRISWLNLALSCFALAGLLLSKFSGVLMIPMGLLLLAVRLFNPSPLDWALGRSRQIHGRLKQIATYCGVIVIQILVVALLIWASYGFRYSRLQPSTGQQGQQPISLDVLLQNAADFGFTRDFVQFAQEHRLLPESYLYGFTYTMLTAQRRQAFLNGQFSIHGWMGYFPYALLVKTPLELFVVLILAAAGAWFWPRSEIAKMGQTRVLPENRGGWYAIAPLLVLLGVYWLVSLTSHLNIGHRHLLPTYPPMFILAGAAAAWFAGPTKLIANRPTAAKGASNVQAFAKPGRKVIIVAQIAIAASLVLSAVEALANWPNYLAYFNCLAGGPHNGYKHLVDSSLDWGQDLKELKWWLDKHPEDAKHVYLGYFGTASSDYYGIKAIQLPGYISHYQPHVPQPLTAGTYCISVTLLQGVYLNFPSKWNSVYERIYQQSRERVLAYRQAADNPDALQKLTAGATQKDIENIFGIYECLRFARLCSFLRTRKPDADVGHTIFIFLLNDAEVQQAAEGPPVELLPDCELDAKECLGIKPK